MTIHGIPLHPLLVHAVVVLLPLVAAAAVLVSLWPAARRKLTFLVPLGAVAVLAVVPPTISAGAQLSAELGNPAAFARHEQLGRGILPWSIALAAATVAQWGWDRFRHRWGQPRWVGIGLAGVVVVVAVGAVVQTVLAGDAGARLVWQGVVPASP